MAVQNRFNTRLKNQGTLETTQTTTTPDIDHEGEESENDEDKDDKGEADKDEDVEDEDDKYDANKDEFVERREPDTIGRTKRWILSSGTDVGQIIKNNEKSEDIVAEIDEISLRKIEAKYKITLGEQDKAYLIEIKRAVLTYAENLADVDLPISESALDNSLISRQDRIEDGLVRDLLLGFGSTT
ncbi:14815_t:CDS:2 [Acaulospora colombiana]|uniref:14815_t:CDS:1 n=1 Tax=Acaulospora colombiana TaxID=27376 RepID=A0ACA9L108_9GLOM|nr:14815_t:CDS:2 [Acaulospora colombiana]